MVRPRRELELADLTFLTGAVLGTTGTLPVRAALRAWTEDAKLTPRGPPASHTPTGCVTVWPTSCLTFSPDLPPSQLVAAPSFQVLGQDSGVPLDPLPLPHPTGSALIRPKPARFSPPPWRWPSWSSPLRPRPPVQTLAPTVRPPHSCHQRATVSTRVRSAPPPPTGLPSTLAQVLTEALASSLSPHHSLCYNHNISLIVSPSCQAWSCPRTFARAEPLPGMLFSQISRLPSSPSPGPLTVYFSPSTCKICHFMYLLSMPCWHWRLSSKKTTHFVCLGSCCVLVPKSGPDTQWVLRVDRGPGWSLGKAVVATALHLPIITMKKCPPDRKLPQLRTMT